MRRARVAGLGLVLVTATSVLPLAAQEAPGERVPPARVDSDLHDIRNIFRFADEPARAPAGASGRSAAREPLEPPSSEAVVPAGPRLVGLVRRSDHLVAALAIEGEVVLLSEEQSAGGFTVTEITEEGVRLRGPEGDESTLRLP